MAFGSGKKKPPLAKSTVGELKELAQKYRGQGKRLLAAATYQKIIEAEPENPRWPQKAGEEYRTAGQRDKSISMFLAAAELYARQGFDLKAITLCKLVLDQDRANQVAQRLLAGFSAPASAAAPAVASTAAGRQPRAGESIEACERSEQARPSAGEEPAEVVEEIDAADLNALLEPGGRPGRQPAPAAFSIPPGETLDAVDLGQAMTPTAASPQIEIEAVEIPIDEPETSEAPTPAAPATESSREDILTRLPPIPIFSSLGRHALQALVERTEVRTFAPGARLITQGEAGNSLFVLVDGEVAVFLDGPPRVDLARLEDGAFFGEIALVTRIPRTASVEAVRECQVLEISREVFNELVQCYPDMVKVVLRHLRERLVRGLVETHSLFAPFAESERKQLVRRFTLLEAAGGCVFAQEGVPADGLYLILCGEAESRRGGALPRRLGTGDVVGAESLLTGRPSLVSVRTRTKCWVLKLREETFREVILTHSPVLAALSDIMADQDRRAAAVAAGGALERDGIPLY